MSLQLWLPLIDSSINQGLSGNEITSVGVTYSTSGGKIATKMSNFSSAYLSCANPIATTSQTFSFAAWVKSTSTSATQSLFNARTSAGSGIAVFLIGGKIRFDFGSTGTASGTYSASAWFHLCVTRNASGRKIYINGSLVASEAAGSLSGMTSVLAAIGASSTTTMSSTNYFQGNLQDVRVYDHCLSPKEVHELAKGLCLHYKFDGTGYTSASELTEFDCSGMGHNGTKTGSIAYNTSGIVRNDKRYNFPSSGSITYSGLTLGTGMTESLWVGTDHIVRILNASGGFASGYKNGTAVTTDPLSGVTIDSTTLSVSAQKYISDFRIYATTLTAEDAKELYNVGGCVDNNGNIYAYSFIEVDSGQDIKKTGVWNDNIISEYKSPVSDILNSTPSTLETDARIYKNTKYTGGTGFYEI